MVPSTLYPLRFRPTFRRYLWGGRRLGEVLGKPIGAESDYAESWEVVDHGDDQSVVAAGPLAGTTLAQLIARSKRDLLGAHANRQRFPLLFKLLDCNRNLSVQVHPNDAQAARLNPPDWGKTEAWVILDALPGSQLYAGLRAGVDRAELERAISQGAVQRCLNAIQPTPGDCVFIPAGTVHALGEGLLVAEIQQSSDTTFRLFDWNRVGADGRPRPLHVEQSLATIDFQAPPVTVQQPRAAGRPDTEQLVCCDKFVLDRRRLEGAAALDDPSERFHIINVVRGQLEISDDPIGEPLVTGQTVLIPAACGDVRLVADHSTVVLDMYLPDEPC